MPSCKPSCEGPPLVRTGGGEPVLVLGDVGVDALQHHPHGESKEPGQEPIEDQVEEQDQAWGG